MDEQLIQAVALIAARLEDGGKQLLIELLPAPLGDAVSQASSAVISAEGEAIALLLRELQPPERGAPQGTTSPGSTSPESTGAVEEEEAPERETAGSASTSRRHATLSGVLLGLVATSVEPERAARLLDQLPRHMKGQLLQALVVVTGVSASRQDLGTEAAGLAADLREQLGAGEEWGVEKAVEIVRALNDDGRTGRALSAVAEIDDTSLAQIQNRLYGFEDLMKLQDAELQVLMMQVDNTTLGRALQKTAEETKKRLYANMSARRRRIVAEEEELCEEATEDEIEEAHGAVMDAVRELYRTRKIDTYFGSAQEESRPRPSDDSRERATAPSGPGSGDGPPTGEARPEGERVKSAPTTKKRKSPLGAVLGGLGAVVLIGLAWMWFGGGASTSTTKSKPPPATSAAGSSSKAGSGGEVRVGSDGGKQQAAASPGEVTRTPVRKTRTTADGKAVLELPDTRNEVEPISDRAQVYHEQTADAEEPKGLFMAVGRVRTTILDEDFYVRTPVVKITGSQGAVFSTRVVIDRTTYVEVEAGTVTVAEAKSAGGSTKITAGQKARFDP